MSESGAPLARVEGDVVKIEIKLLRDDSPSARRRISEPSALGAVLVSPSGDLAPHAQVNHDLVERS
jgi:hypothetical protein